ncbi:MAG: hypothetical protein HYX92_09930 [Chloroflexi bacterium]|nr:hypothetical protein [Chloroflexota bacterium]
MLEIKKTTLAFDAADVTELEQILNSADGKEAFAFLKRSVYDRMARKRE